jgi:hypothetical protein
MRQLICASAFINRFHCMCLDSIPILRQRLNHRWAYQRYWMSDEEEKPKKAAEKVVDLNERVWGLADEGLKQKRLSWKRVFTQISSFVILILVIIYLNPITSTLADGIKSLKSSLSDPTNTAVVGNYLLTILILATVGVVFIPFLVRWLNRPKPRLDSLSYFTHPLTIRPDPAFPNKTMKRNVHLVHVNIINDGRGHAVDPVLLMGSSRESILPLTNVIFSAVRLDREITLLDGNVYDAQDDKQLAISFIRQGTRKVSSIPSRGDGTAFLVGFAFEGGNYFYGASDTSAGVSKQKLGEKEWTYLHFTIHARNLGKKQLKKNLKAKFPAWDTVSIDYRTLEIPPYGEND